MDSSGYNTALVSAGKSAKSTKSTLASLTEEAKNTGNGATKAGGQFGVLEDRLKNIGVGLETTRTKLNAVSSGFIGAETSTEALTAQNEALEESVYSLNEQLETQKQLLSEAAAKYGEADEKTQKYQQAVNNTTADINRVNAQINNNTIQIQQNAAQGKGLNAVLGKIGVNVGDLAQKFGLSSSMANKLTTALGSNAAGAVALTAAVGKVIKKFNEFSKEQARHIDDINTLARNYHLTAQQIQQFNYMSKQIDVDTQTITGSISRLTRTMGSAKKGTGDAAEAFDSLGVKITNADGSLRDSTSVFFDTIDALGEINNETDQDAIAMQIFGRSAMDLRGVIDAGSDGLKSYAQEAERMGVVLSDEANGRLQSLQDEADRVDSVQEAAKENWAAVWAPAAKFFEGVKGGFFMIANKGAQALLGGKNNTDQLSGAMDGATDSSNSLNEATKKVSSSFNKQSESLKKALNATQSLTNGYDKLKASWSALEDAGFGKVIGQYDASTGVLKQTFSTNEEYSAYRSGSVNFGDIYSGGYARDTFGNPTAQQINLSVQLDGREIARTSYDYDQEEKRLRGNSII